MNAPVTDEELEQLRAPVDGQAALDELTTDELALFDLEDAS